MATENKNLSQFDKKTLPNVSDCTFGIVVSNWNENITHNLFKGAYQTLIDCEVSEENIIKIDVPGSFELIYGASKLMKDKPFLDAIIVIGCVIEGETKHFDFVCQGVTSGIAHLNTLGTIPVIFCVLTDQNMQQSIDRSGGKLGNKGIEAAVTAIKLTSI
jgi:6,7-dimethyl-8-ribityllumazine synthase